MTERTSLMLIRVEEKNLNFVRFTTYGDRTGTLRTHFIQKNTTFNYDKMSVDEWYLINSQNVDNIWVWRMAFPVDIDSKFI